MANPKTTEPETKSEEVVTALPTYRNSDLQAVTTFEDALALMRETYGDTGVITADEVIGNGFAMLKTKDVLIGVPFALVKWQFYPGRYANNFVSAMVVTKDGKKYLLIDGGTGICAQLQEVTDNTGRQGGMVARNGLTRSDYTYTDSETQEETPAHTFYIDTSAVA